MVRYRTFHLSRRLRREAILVVGIHELAAKAAPVQRARVAELHFAHAPAGERDGVGGQRQELHARKPRQLDLFLRRLHGQLAGHANASTGNPKLRLGILPREGHNMDGLNFGLAENSI